MPRLPSRLALSRGISFLAASMASSSSESGSNYPIRSYTPTNPNDPFPYSPADFTPQDSSSDTSFYSTPLFVTHIDDNAIHALQKYYSETLPRKGRILDFCSSWISHYPPEVEKASQTGYLEILGTGMNKSELSRNPTLNAWTVQDLNQHPDVRFQAPPPSDDRDTLGVAKLDASTCVVSIDYLTKPVEVLSSVLRLMHDGGRVHLAMSNRCFPTKVVRRWLQVSEEERLEMVGDYLWWGGWREVEIVEVVKGTWLKDPLWVVRWTKLKAGQREGIS